jgi:hypothetical protein
MRNLCYMLMARQKLFCLAKENDFNSIGCNKWSWRPLFYHMVLSALVRLYIFLLFKMHVGHLIAAHPTMSLGHAVVNRQWRGGFTMPRSPANAVQLSCKCVHLPPQNTWPVTFKHSESHKMLRGMSKVFLKLSWFMNPTAPSIVSVNKIQVEVWDGNVNPTVISMK